jgi:hypothetical protein
MTWAKDHAALREAPAVITESPYERQLDSFADDVICYTKQSAYGHWNAWLDVAPADDWPSTPDFLTGAENGIEAIRLCARKIREDQRGIGKYAPHDLDLYSLRRWWTLKERFIANG